MLDLNKPDVGCRISTSRMSNFYMSDVRDFNKSYVGFLSSRMSDFYKSDVGFVQVGCRMAPISFRRKEKKVKRTSKLWRN